jgi:CheY-like chemotaxis protein
MKTVLVVDDEIDILAFLVELLDSEGYRAVSARDGIAALKLIDKHEVDLIIIDIMMPRLDGIGFVRQLRKHPVFRGIPVILMSAADRPRMDDLRVHAFLAKPFDLDTLLALVDDVISAR